MAPRKFVVLNNRDLAITTGSTGLTRIAFTEADRNTTEIENIEVKLPTVSFQTTNPCVAVIDTDNIQWDLNSKRVWYTDTTVTVDLSDILYAKGLVITPASITTLTGEYIRYRTKDTEATFAWKATSTDAVPPYLYTKEEVPVTGSTAYWTASATGTQTELVQTSIPVVTEPITTGQQEWNAVFAVSNPDISGGTLSGITYEEVND